MDDFPIMFTKDRTEKKEFASGSKKSLTIGEV